MQINFPTRYARNERKNNREKSEPKLHINFRSSLSRCQSEEKKKTLRGGMVVGMEEEREGHSGKAYWQLAENTCV